jgi:hypothetical protein
LEACNRYDWLIPADEQAKLDGLKRLRNQPRGAIVSLEVHFGWQTQATQPLTSLQRDWLHLIRWLDDELARRGRRLWCDARLQDPSVFTLHAKHQGPTGPSLQLIQLRSKLEHDAVNLVSIRVAQRRYWPAELPGLELLTLFCLNPQLADGKNRMPALALAGVEVRLTQRTCLPQAIVLVVDEAGLAIELRSIDRGGYVVPRRVLEPRW